MSHTDVLFSSHLLKDSLRASKSAPFMEEGLCLATFTFHDSPEKASDRASNCPYFK